MVFKLCIEKIEEYHEAFHKYPTDEKGRISTEHLSELFMTVNVYPFDREIQEMTARLKDPSHIHFLEFLSILDPPRSPVDDVIDAVSVYDTKGTGRASATALREVLKRNNFTRERICILMDKVEFDVNNEFEYEKLNEYIQLGCYCCAKTF